MIMENERPKQILDKTFRHLEQVLEEMRRERRDKEMLMRESRSGIPEQRKTEKSQKL